MCYQTQTSSGAFLHIQEASDKTSLDVITQAAERHGVKVTTCGWICSMLERRNIVTTFSGEALRASMAKGSHREVCFCLYCGAWLWTNFYGSSMAMIITQ
jgi:hypothetical protein